MTLSIERSAPMADIDLSSFDIDQLADLVGKAHSEMASREKQRRTDLRSELERRNQGRRLQVPGHLSRVQDARETPSCVSPHVFSSASRGSTGSGLSGIWSRSQRLRRCPSSCHAGLGRGSSIPRRLHRRTTPTWFPARSATGAPQRTWTRSHFQSASSAASVNSGGGRRVQALFGV